MSKARKRRPARTDDPTRPGAAGADPMAEMAATGRALVLSERSESTTPLPDLLPILPLRSDVVFPQTVVPLVVNRGAGIKLIDEINMGDKTLALATQRQPDTDDPTVWSTSIRPSPLARF